MYVDRFVDRWDFSALGLGHCSGWRVRSWSAAPLETTDGTRMAGFTPQGSLKPLDPLSPEQARAVARDMALADFNEAMADLAEILRRQEPQQCPTALPRRRHKRTVAAMDSGPAPSPLLRDGSDHVPAEAPQHLLECGPVQAI